MRTFTNPKELNVPILEFTYEGCRYAGVAPGVSFSVLSEGLAEFLIETFPQLVEQDSPAPVVENQYCCTKCGRDCKSSYMRERHEKVCKETPKGSAMILKPTYIFWNYKNLDKTQLTEDQLIPADIHQPKGAQQITEKDVTQPMPGKEGMTMIGKRMETVTTDRDGIDWYGPGVEEDSV